MTLLNPINSLYPLISGVNDGNNVSPTPAKVHLEPGFKGDVVERIVSFLGKGGRWETSDGRIKFVFSENLHEAKIKGIDPKEFIKDGFKVSSAKTYFGEIGPNKEFVFGKVLIDHDKTAALVIIDSKNKNNKAFLPGIVTHELKHAADFISGFSTSFKNKLKEIVNSGDAPDKTKREVLVVCDIAMNDIRAYLAQLDYYLYNSDKFSKKDLEENIAMCVSQINIYYGVRNYMIDKHYLYFGYSKIDVKSRFEKVFEEAVSFSMVSDFNDMLAPYNMGINPKHQNSSKHNEHVLREVFPL